MITLMIPLATCCFAAALLMLPYDYQVDCLRFAWLSLFFAAFAAFFH